MNPWPLCHLKAVLATVPANRAWQNQHADGILGALYHLGGGKEEGPMEPSGWPTCRKCTDGELLPLSDFGSQGAPIHYKAWVCSNPDCGFNIKIRNGDVYLNEPIASGAMHAPRIR